MHDNGEDIEETPTKKYCTEPFYLSYAARLLIHHLAQGASQLVGARCALAVATDALYASDDILSLHTTHELRDALRVTIAAAIELHALHNIILQTNLNCLRTDTTSRIYQLLFHSKICFEH